MNSLETGSLLILAIVVFTASRRWAFLAMMVGVLYLPQGPSVAVLGLNLYAIRFLEIAGFVRVVIRGEISSSRLKNIDKTLLLLYCYTTIIFLLRSNRDQAYQIGVAVDAFLCYFTFRGLSDTVENFKWFLRAFIVVLAPYVLIVAVESFGHYNAFSLMGGVTSNAYRERLRCVGSFRHPSLLGTLGGCFMPLYIGLWFARNSRIISSFGIAFCLFIVWASNSGAPVSLVGVGIIGWTLWVLRTKMYLVRRGIAGVIVLLAIFMKAPIWYLVARVSDISGGDGYHRAHLLDMAFQDLGKWWLVGMSLNETGSWFPYNLGTGGSDMTNYFVNWGLSAGLVALVLFITLLTRVCKNLGRSLATFRNNPESADQKKELLFWGLGVVVVVHIFNWVGIIYFDQTSVIWFMQLAVISTLTAEIYPSPQRTSISEKRMSKRSAVLVPLRNRAFSTTSGPSFLASTIET